ncbi:MAG: WYL domain-containing protein [Deltaproteobacteria bacterium]|jgi:hypothetical protein|nr:WYL domain-containing protein [Deltaproteobacteria bacterium]
MMAENELTRAQKTLFILQLLFDRAGSHNLTISQIHNKLSCSEETARRIVNDIIDYAPRICAKEDDGLKLIDSRAMAIASNIFYPNIKTQDLIFAKAIIELNKDLLGKDVSDFLATIINNIRPEVDLGPPAPVSRLVTKEYVDYGPTRELLRRFIEAIRTRMICEVSYSNAYKETKRLYIAPLEIILFREKIYINGFQSVKILNGRLNNPEERSLLLHRVKEVTITDTLIAPNLKTTDKGQANEEDYGFFGYVVTDHLKLEVNFAPELGGYLNDHKWPEDAKPSRISPRGRSDYNNWIKLKMNCGNEIETLNWLLGFGGKVAIIHPKSLKNLYRQELRKMAALHGLKVSPIKPK